MIRRLTPILVVALACSGWHTALAAGTPANTTISTWATANYQIGAATVTQTSNVLTATVAEVLDVHVTWQDGSAVTVFPNETDRVLAFRITNTGNGDESYTLTVSSAQGQDQFDPALSALFLDSNDNNLLDMGVDTVYMAGINDPALAPDAALTVFALNDIPGDLDNGDTGHCRIAATANTGAGTPGDILAGRGDGGTDAVIGGTGASAATLGTYVVSNVQISVAKSATVVDPQNGNRPVTAAVITYQIDVQATGSGTAQAVVFNDPIPENTTYRPNSLRLNGALLSDAADGDVGDVGGTTTDSVTVFLGDLAANAPTQTIMFDVTID
jgi:uncharacterized repeat protein (TIGR01451 family)